MFIAIFISILNIFTSHAESTDINYEPICVTEICNKTAANMKRLMNLNMDPCTDFYNYACGNWPINEYSQYSALGKIINHRLNEMLDAVPPTEKNTPLAKAKMYYDSCMNTDRIESETIADLLKIMDKNGGWPMIMSESDWMSKKKSWQEVDMAYRKLNYYSPIFSLSVKNTRDKPKIFSITVNGDRDIVNELERLCFELESYHHIRLRIANENFTTFMALPKVINYMNTMKNISKIIASHRNYSISEKTLEDDVKSIVEFEWGLEQALITFLLDPSYELNNLYKVISIDNFQKNYNATCCKTKNSKIDWLNMIKQLFEDVPNVNINGSQMINVISNFFPLLSDLLDRTPERVIVNIIHWQFIMSSYEYLSKDMQTLLKPIFKSLPQRVDSEKRYNKCLEDLSKQFVHALIYGYAQKHIPKKAKDMITQMVLGIAHEMETVINSSTLYNVTVKFNKLILIKSLNWIIGYPDWYNKTKIDHYYDDIEMSQSWLENTLTMNKFALNRQLRIFKDPSVIMEDYMNGGEAYTIPYYNDYKHLIVAPIGFMHSPFFEENQPDVINYGGMGFLLAHELSHAVQIIKSDNNGEIEPRGNSTDPIIQGIVDCFADEFSHYSLFLKNKTYAINSTRTLEENLADTLGVRVGYKAFQAHKKQKTESIVRLPGLENLNNDQLFFLSYAQTQCGSLHPNALLSALNDTHALRMFRIISSLSNSEYFAETFQCSERTEMNPTRKCSPF